MRATEGSTKAKLALYGNVHIPRAFCEKCQGTALILNGALACCGSKPDGMVIEESERISPVVEVRACAVLQSSER